MKRKLRLLLVASLLCTLTVARAGIRGPGKHHGVLVYDRFGGCTLYNGVHLFYVSKAIKAQLGAFSGRPVVVDATDVYQPINPGDALIRAVKSVGPAPPPPDAPSGSLKLTASPAFEAGQKPVIIVQLHNSGPRRLQLHAANLAPTLFMRRPTNRHYFIASDGPSFAILTRTGFASYGDGKARVRGEFWNVWQQRHSTWHIDPRQLPRAYITLEPGQKKQLRIGFDLAPGQYDFISGYGGGTDANACIASNLVAFNVDARGNGVPVQASRPLPISAISIQAARG